MNFLASVVTAQHSAKCNLCVETLMLAKDAIGAFEYRALNCFHPVQAKRHGALGCSVGLQRCKLVFARARKSRRHARQSVRKITRKIA